MEKGHKICGFGLGYAVRICACLPSSRSEGLRQGGRVALARTPTASPQANAGRARARRAGMLPKVER
jgi:hypothetical protein